MPSTAVLICTSCEAVTICCTLRSVQQLVPYSGCVSGKMEAAMDLDDISALELDDTFSDLAPSITFGQPSQALTTLRKQPVPSVPWAPNTTVLERSSQHQPAPSPRIPAYRCTVTSEDIDCLSVDGYSQGASQVASKRLRLSSPQPSRAGLTALRQPSTEQPLQGSQPYSQQPSSQCHPQTRSSHPGQQQRSQQSLQSQRYSQQHQQSQQQLQLTTAVCTALPPRACYHLNLPLPYPLKRAGCQETGSRASS